MRDGVDSGLHGVDVGNDGVDFGRDVGDVDGEGIQRRVALKSAKLLSLICDRQTGNLRFDLQTSRLPDLQFSTV